MEESNNQQCTGSFDGDNNLSYAVGSRLTLALNANDVPVLSNKPEDIEAMIKRDNNQAINKTLLEILNPHLGANEAQKRKFKEPLMEYVKQILELQFKIVGFLTFLIFVNICFPMIKGISDTQLSQMLGFLKYYITAIIAEFIAMLAFIVEFVFDRSIVSLTRDIIAGNKK